MSCEYLKNAENCILDGSENQKNLKVLGVARDKNVQLFESLDIK